MSWYVNPFNRRQSKSKYLVPDTSLSLSSFIDEPNQNSIETNNRDENENETVSNLHFLDQPIDESTIDTVCDAPFSAFDVAFRQVDKTLNKVSSDFNNNHSNISDDSDTDGYNHSNSAKIFGGKNQGYDTSDSENDGSLIVSHMDALFIEEPETIKLPESVEVQIIKLMKKIVSLEKQNKKISNRNDLLINRIKSLKEELSKVQQEALEMEAINGVHRDENESFSLLKTGSVSNFKKEQEKLAKQKERDQNRKRMLNVLDDDDDDVDDFSDFDLSNPMGGLKKLLSKMNRCIKQSIPFKSDIKIIESRFGSSTASFFLFFRWLFINNFIIFIMQSIFVGLHISVLLQRGHSNILSSPNITELQSSWITSKNIDWTVLEGGLIPKVFSFSSYTPNYEENVVNIDIPLFYSCVLFLTLCILILFTIQKWVYENAKNKKVEAFEGGSSKRWSKFIFTAFDHSIHGKIVNLDQKKLITETINVMYIEDQSDAIANSRSNLQWCTLYAKRIVIACIYIGIQLSGWYV